MFSSASSTHPYSYVQGCGEAGSFGFRSEESEPAAQASRRHGRWILRIQAGRESKIKNHFIIFTGVIVVLYFEADANPPPN